MTGTIRPLLILPGSVTHSSYKWAKRRVVACIRGLRKHMIVKLLLRDPLSYGDKHHDHKQLRKERIYLTVWSPLSKKGKARSLGQKPGGRNWSRSYRKGKLTGLFFRASSTFHLLIPRSISPGVALLQVSWALLHQSSIKKMKHKFAHKLIWVHFLNWSFLFQNDSSLCHTDKH